MKYIKFNSSKMKYIKFNSSTKIIFLSLKIVFGLANSNDSDEMSYYAMNKQHNHHLRTDFGHQGG